MKAVKSDTAFQKEGYKKTKLGWIPENWEVKALGDCTSYIKGFAFKSKDYKSEGVRVIRISDTNANSIKKINGIYISIENAHLYSKWKLKKNDLIFTTVGSRPPLYESMVGKVIKVTQENENSLLNQNAVIIRGNGMISQKLLLYFFKQKRYLNHIEAIVRGNANQVSITLKELFKFTLPIPPLPEQQKIASILNTWDKAIDAQEQLIAQKQELKKGLMQQLLTGKKRFDGFSEDWEEVRLNELVKINPKGEDLPKEFNYISLESVKNGLLKSTLALNKTNAPSRAQRVLQRDDVLFQTVRPYQMNNYYFDLAGNYVASTGYAQLRCSSEIAKFVYYLIHTEQFVNKVLSRCTGSNYPAINPSSLGKIKIRIPMSKSEKLMISDLLTDVDEELNNLLKKTNQYIEQKQGLMQQLLTGQKRVRV